MVTFSVGLLSCLSAQNNEMRGKQCLTLLLHNIAAHANIKEKVLLSAVLMEKGNSQHRSANSSCVTVRYREEPVWQKQVVSATYLNIPLTSPTWEMESADIPIRNRNKVGSSPYWQVFLWRKILLNVFAVLNMEKNGREKKKKMLFSSLVGFFVWFLFYVYPSLCIPFYPTPSCLPRAAARSRCHHLFLYFPHLGGWKRSWLSFLADSVISARPQAWASAKTNRWSL